MGLMFLTATVPCAVDFIPAFADVRRTAWVLALYQMLLMCVFAVLFTTAAHIANAKMMHLQVPEQRPRIFVALAAILSAEKAVRGRGMGEHDMAPKEHKSAQQAISHGTNEGEIQHGCRFRCGEATAVTSHVLDARRRRSSVCLDAACRRRRHRRDGRWL